MRVEPIKFLGIRPFAGIVVSLLLLHATDCLAQKKFAELDSPSSTAGYLSHLLVNEVPFPGEFSYISVGDSKAAMTQILLVLHSRLRVIPPGYVQSDLTNTNASDIVDVMTAKGQCEGFFRDEDGTPSFAPRVKERTSYLLMLANKGGKPGKFAALLNFAKELSREYVKDQIGSADRFAKIQSINKTKVTGRAYSWMTNKDYYNPGGNFIFIPDTLDGSLGGNRFYTLKKKE